MSDLVAVAIINGIFGVLVLILGKRLSNKVKAVDTKVNNVQEQVVNNHDTNLREEADERHHQNSGKLDEIVDELKRLRKSVGELWKRADFLRDGFEQNRERIHDIEITQEREKRRKK